MGWFSKIEQPMVRDFSIGIWRLFSDLDLSEARKAQFASLHDASSASSRRAPGRSIPIPASWSVLRRDRRGLRAIEGTELLQIKGFPYELRDLLGSSDLVERHRNGLYVTLRLTSSMYHRFHAPHDCRVEQVTYISGDTWNVNPIALRRIERLFCKNERAIIRTRLAASHDVVTLVPVAAILVASIRLHCLDVLLNLRHRGANVIPARATSARERKWDGSSTARPSWRWPRGFFAGRQCAVGKRLRMGQPLMRLPGAS